MMNSRNVLIADDNANMRAALRSVLKNKAQVEMCYEASNGIEAIQQAMEQKPDLVLMDLSMPKMNGVGAAAVIRQALPQAKIIMLTLHANLLNESTAKAIGVDLVLSKDEGSAGILRALQHLLADS